MMILIKIVWLFWFIVGILSLLLFVEAYFRYATGAKGKIACGLLVAISVLLIRWSMMYLF